MHLCRVIFVYHLCKIYFWKLAFLQKKTAYSLIWLKPYHLGSKVLFIDIIQLVNILLKPENFIRIGEKFGYKSRKQRSSGSKTEPSSQKTGRILFEKVRWWSGQGRKEKNEREKERERVREKEWTNKHEMERGDEGERRRKRTQTGKWTERGGNSRRQTGRRERSRVRDRAGSMHDADLESPSTLRPPPPSNSHPATIPPPSSRVVRSPCTG